MAVETLSASRKCRWRSGKTRRECCLNCSKIASSHSQADIHPVGMESFKSTQASPSFEDPFVFKEGHQKILVIACQRDHGALASRHAQVVPPRAWSQDRDPHNRPGKPSRHGRATDLPYRP